MPPLPLEPTDDRANPIFKDQASCKKWLAQLQLTNLQLAHSQLLTQLNEFNRFPVRGDVRLETLETLRDTIHHVQNDYAKRFIGKPLPLNENELVSFFALVQLWHAMSHGYQRCLQACIAGDKHLVKQATLLCQRTLLYSGLAITEHLRTGYEFDSKLWHQLHGIYSYAEEQGLLFKEVSDPLTKSQSTCHRSYLSILLACYECAAQLSRSQLQLLAGWLPLWAGTLNVERNYTASREDAQPLGFDLDSAQGLLPARMIQPGANVRYLAMVPLSKLLRVKTILLQQGKTPKQVELGESGSNHECIELLTLLHKCWCEGTGIRGPAANRVQLCCGLENIYAQLSGKPFRSAGRATASEAAARKQLEAFGSIMQSALDKPGASTGHMLESWLLENKDIQGAQLTREGLSGVQVGNNQLLALRRSETESFVLGISAKASVTRTGQLHVSMRFLPGEMQAVTLHANEENLEPGERSVAGLLLQAPAALNIPASLIVPPNWFRPGRVVDIQHQKGEKQRAKLGFSVTRGMDYERVSFTLM